MEDDNSFYNSSYINKGNSFVEQFYCIGLDSNLILQNYLYSTDINTLNENKSIRPEIITKFPNIEKKLIYLDDETLIKVYFLI